MCTSSCSETGAAEECAYLEIIYRFKEIFTVHFVFFSNHLKDKFAEMGNVPPQRLVPRGSDHLEENPGELIRYWGNS